MASEVSFVGTGAVATTATTATTITGVTSPAGNVGDLLVALIIHDDNSDGPGGTGTMVKIAVSGGTDLSWTEIGDQSLANASLSDDCGISAFWLKEDQAAARNWDFGTLSNSEEISAVIGRYRDQDLTTPIDVSETQQAGDANGNLLSIGKEFNVVLPGSMVVWWAGFDTTTVGIILDGPNGFTNRLHGAGRALARMELETRVFHELDHPFPVTLDGLGNTVDVISFFQAMSFVINPVISTDTISGVTKDRDGAVVTSAQVYLYKETASATVYVDELTSDGVTGAYSFTITNDTDAKFFTVAFKTASNLFGISDQDLAPGDSGKDIFMFTTAQLPVAAAGGAPGHATLSGGMQ